MTRKLFYEFPREAEFTAKVVECKSWEKGLWAVTLDQTAFYPASGGQPEDVGWLAGVEVSEVLAQGDRVLHVMSKPLPEGTSVEGRIDWDRRVDHRQQHSGQHILSRALETLGAETIGFHLGEERCSIDLNVALQANDLEKGEHMANEVVLDDRDIEVQWHADEKSVPEGLRNQLPAERPIRLVHIVDFDLNPCCGTHCERTGQVGTIKILRSEKKKEGLRVEFACGWRAFRDYAKRHKALRGMALSLTTEEFLVPERVASLTDAQKNLRNRLEKTEKELLYYKCLEWSREPEAPVIRDLGAGMEGHLAYAVSRLLEAGVPTVFLYCKAPENTRLVFASSHKEINAGTLLGQALTQVGGRGGGNAAMAQGSIPSVRLDSLQEAIRKAVQETHGSIDS